MDDVIAKILDELALVGENNVEAINLLKENDAASLSHSLLWTLGATVNQPYPNFPPSYPFTTMQPHGKLVRVGIAKEQQPV